MGNRIRINCRKVYDNGVFYEKNSDELVLVQKELDDICNEVGKIFGGPDGHNFQVSLTNHLQALDDVVNFLGENGDLLKKNALEHSGLDNTFATKMERSDMDD